MTDILQQLSALLEARKAESPDKSYVASLHAKGLDHILKKIGEESAETIMAAKDAKISGDNQALIYETADLWFHSLVMLSHLGESAEPVLKELERRLGVSGIDEKASRSPKP